MSGVSLPGFVRDEHDGDVKGEDANALSFGSGSSRVLSMSDKEREAILRASFRANVEPGHYPLHIAAATIVEENWNLCDEKADDHGLPLKLLRSRCEKWEDMMDSWPDWIRNRTRKVRSRVFKGIPPDCRRRAWQLLSGSNRKMHNNPGLFCSLLSKATDSVPERLSGGLRTLPERIAVDIPRTFPERQCFMDLDGYGQRALYFVLKAYSLYRPEVGYVQGMNFLAALFLMYMPPEEAFWLLVVTNDQYMEGYFGDGMPQLHVDSLILEELLQLNEKKLFRHFQNNALAADLYTPRWFLCMFTLSLPWQTALRFWDAFFFEGPKFLFRASLGLMKVCKKEILKQRGLENILPIVQTIPVAHASPDDLLDSLLRVTLDEGQLVDLHKKSLRTYLERVRNP
eukprot:Rmarinus@m.30045